MVGEEEYKSDYNASRPSLNDFLKHKMYRLNIWQQSANPWLRLGDWEKCRQEYAAEDMEGCECYAGLDLARTRDTTAIALIFPGEDEQQFRQLAFFWLPKDRADELRDKVRYREWAAKGFVTLTDGNETDFNFVRLAINDLRQRYNIRCVAYDGTYAAQLMQRLREEDGMHENEQCKFPQTMMAFTSATVAYENAIIEGRMHHNGHPLLTWQAGNVEVKSDYNDNIRPIKQQHGDYRTIDGMVAGIMALAMAIQSPPPSVYEDRGPLVL